MTVNTANGPVNAAALGRTLMHEHLVIGMAGWESDTVAPRPQFRDMVAACVDRVEELKSGGFSSIVDPCPSDLGRSVDVIGEVAARTGFNIVFATGLYTEELGGTPYWKMVLRTDPDGDKRLADLFISEIENGVGQSGLKPGIIKIATGPQGFTEHERRVFRAAATASVATGVPITTHTDIDLGDEQLRFLTELGVAPDRVVIGHCCDNPDHDYHMRVVDGGAYIGFDRFGIETPRTDDEKIESILQIRAKAGLGQVIVSHDTVWCMFGQMLSPAFSKMMLTMSPMHFTRSVAPRMMAAGISSAEIDSMLVDNPRRYFEISDA